MKFDAVILERGSIVVSPDMVPEDANLRLRVRAEHATEGSTLSSTETSTPLLRISFYSDSVQAHLHYGTSRTPVPTATHMSPCPINGQIVSAQVALTNIASTVPGGARFSSMLVIARSAPWNKLWHMQWDGLPAFPTDDGPILGVSTTGWRNGVWHDGPLWVSRSATVEAFVPSGGDGALLAPLPSHLPTKPSQLDWNAALALEGPPAQQAHRCLVSSLRNRLNALAPQNEATVSVVLDQLTPARAVLLALLRQARPDLRLLPITSIGHVHSQSTWPASWRRFAQNAGIVQPSRGMPEPTAVLSLTDFTDVVPATLIRPLAEQINSLSDLIPQSLF